MEFNLSTLTRLCICASLSFGAAFNAVADVASDVEPVVPKLEYNFKQPTTPKKLLKYTAAVFGVFDNHINTIGGTPFFNTEKKHMISSEINPTCANYIVVTKGKKPLKDNHAVIYSFNGMDEPVHKFNNKKIGYPTSAIFTPDARKILIATTKGLQIIEPRKYETIDQMELPFEVNKMALSGNCYYLVACDSTKVSVINFQDKKVRKTWDFGVKVHSFCFNPDDTELAILTEDGVLSIYDTRTFIIKKTLDDLGQGISCAYNFDGKYISVVTSPEIIAVVNLVKEDDRDYVRWKCTLRDFHPRQPWQYHHGLYLAQCHQCQANDYTRALLRQVDCRPGQRADERMVEDDAG